MFSPFDIHHSMNADPHQSHQQDEYSNGQWGDVGGYSTDWAQYNATSMFAYIAPAPSPPVSTTPISTTVTPVTMTGGSKPRRILTNDERRRMCEYHESHPDITQIQIGGTSAVLYPPPILQLTLSSNVWCRQKVCTLLLIESLFLILL
jgi:hypothetical protein